MYDVVKSERSAHMLAAWTLTNQLTDLGLNVTINCELDLKEVAWLLLNPPDPPVLILHSFLNPPTAFYFNKNFTQKYSLQSKHLFPK